ncbi:MAG: Hint domain-containing protein [Acidiphilium sp.]|nr:Hint domain-containing protein [Acidiphilium sp.]
MDITVALATLTPNTIYVGGNATIDSTVSALSGLTVYDDGGSVTAAKGVVAGALSSATINLDNGGTFTNGPAVLSALSGTTINFGANGGAFVVNAGGAALNILSGVTINGFSNAKDQLAFTNLPAGTTIASYSISNSTSPGSQTITLLDSSGATVDSVTVAGTSFATGTVTVGQTGPLTVIDSGTTITIDGGPSGSGLPCFAGGTRILTLHGETPVEELREGSEVILADGTLARVIWLGHRGFDLTRHPHPEEVLPVLIEAGAIGDGVPARDLYLSPDHALFLDGHLIPAKTLINGATIRQVARRSVTYYHVELACHAVLLAEATPCESYLETGNRASFANGGAPVRLHPEFGTRPDWQAIRESAGCAPFAEMGPVVETVRARLLQRAAIGTVTDPALTISEGTDGSIVIASRCAVRGHLTADPRDRRRLGVKIAAIQRADGTAIPLDHPDLVEGWHGLEADGRWTDGAAVIPASLAGGGLPRLTLAATLAYPADETFAGRGRRVTG